MASDGGQAAGALHTHVVDEPGTTRPDICKFLSGMLSSALSRGFYQGYIGSSALTPMGSSALATMASDGSEAAGADIAKCPEASPSSTTDASHLGATLTVQSMSGRTLATIEPPLPSTVHGLKDAISFQLGIQADFVKVLHGASLLEDDDLAEAYATQIVTAIIDNSAAFLWDTIRNPDSDQLCVEGSHVRCPHMRVDYLNVVTQAPLPAGVHFIEFVMHYKGDEQWCGVVSDKALGWGKKVSGHSRDFKGCFYYCGRGRTPGHLQHYGRDRDWPQVASVGNGDIIGMAIDCDNRLIAFCKNGECTGAACKLPPEGPLYLLTHVDMPDDHVELRLADIEDAPPGVIAALSQPVMEGCDSCMNE
jgi:hypothetical protein